MNTKDPYKGRTGRAVVNDVAVRKMRFLHSHKGVPAEVLAREYGLGLDACRRILHWKSWRHVSEVGPGVSEADMIAAGAFQAKPPTRSEQDEVAASQNRLLDLLRAEGAPTHPFLPPAADEPTGVGLARLQAEMKHHKRGDTLLNELAGHPNGAVVGSTNTAPQSQPDGGKQ